MADDVFTNPYYEHLEGALARHEAAGHDVTAILAALAPTITPGEDQADPAAQLAKRIDHATTSRGQGRGARARRRRGLDQTARPSPTARRARVTWIALYRHRYEITGRAPLGDPKASPTPSRRGR